MLTNQPIRKKGAIGIRTDNDKEWVGLFIGDDSNPLAFAPPLWQMLQEHWKNLTGWGKSLLQCGYWEEFLNDGICPYCGKWGVGQPHNITGYVLNKYRAEGPDSLALDPHCNGHSHLPPKPTCASIHAKTDGMWLEWVYVINPKTYMLEVFRAVRTGETFEAKLDGKKWPQPEFRYFPTGMFSLLGKEPNWAIVESQGLKTSAYYHDKFQRCKKFTL